MDIIITLTSVGTDQGTLFDLYSDVDSFATPFDTDVPVASLQAGYTASAPEGTTVVRVCGQEAACVNCIDITPTYTTSTSTTTSTTTGTPTTTTTTTLTGLDEANISDTTSAIADCLLPLVDTVYIDTTTPGTLTAGDIVYNDAGGLTTFVGNGEYYRIDLDGAGTEFSVRINSSGVILIPVVNC